MNKFLNHLSEDWFVVVTLELGSGGGGAEELVVVCEWILLSLERKHVSDRHVRNEQRKKLNAVLLCVEEEIGKRLNERNYLAHLTTHRPASCRIFA